MTLARTADEPRRMPVSVPWGRDWQVGPHTFRIEEIYENGRYMRTESYAIHSDGTHNPPGHFTGARPYCLGSLRHLASHYHCSPGERCTCQLYPTSTCADARQFLAVTNPEVSAPPPAR